MRFALVNLGCKVNRVEADAFTAALDSAGCTAVQRDADVVVINSCTVTAEAMRKTRKEIRRALLAHPHARVLVTGCAAVIDPQMLCALDKRVECIGKDEVLSSCLGTESSSLLPRTEGSPLRVGGQFPTRVGIKMQDGCDNACSFCIVHVARGPAYSTPFQQVLDEVVRHTQAGVREVVLTGIDLGAYRDGTHTLSDVVRALRVQAPDARLRLSSIEPLSITNDLIELLAREEGMVCRHLHVPLQSGSTKVLGRMARRYTAEQYVSLIERIRKVVPDLSVSTDIIVGFPGESEDDFQETLRVARACAFSKIHIFRYSPRAGTPAASWDNQVPAYTKAERAEKLDTLACSLRTQFASARIGCTERVLVETPWRGMSESYYPVMLDGSYTRGQLASCTFTTIREDGTLSV